MGLPASAYRDYIASPAWEMRKTWWRSHRSPRQRRCRACHAPRTDLHHRTYVRLGCERLRDLVPLCRRHHEALHGLQRRYDYSVERATRLFLVGAALREGLVAILVVVVVTLVVVIR